LFGLASWVATLVGVAFGSVLLALARWGNREVNMFVLNVLAILTGLNAVLDLWYLIFNTDASVGAVRNDAAAFSSQIFPLPAWFWAGLWALIAVGMLGVAAWFSIVHPLVNGRKSPPRAQEIDFSEFK
jgi:hypothetical protein